MLNRGFYKILRMMKTTYTFILNIVYPCTNPYTGEILKLQSTPRKRRYASPNSQSTPHNEASHLKIRSPYCMRCGKPVHGEETEYCSDCQSADFSYDRGRSLFIHKEPVSTAIYQFKFHNKRIFGEYFARELAEEFRDQIIRWGITEIIPVPLHPKKRKKRGYNQSEILAKELSRALHIPVNSDCIYRIENTRPQKELNDKERRRNLRRAFAIDKNWRPSGNVLIIDDIYTTGSTIDAMSRLLKKRGAKHVYFLTISVGAGD